MVAPIATILEDPRYFPVHIDFANDRVTFVQTSRARLAAAPFLDGRSEIAEGLAIEGALSDALAARWARPTAPDRWIFHVAFCGSTLLATLLDIAGHGFAEREPSVMVQLADAAVPLGRRAIEPTLDLMCALLRRSWQPGEVTICKPSNWANNLIPILTRDPKRIRPLFVATDKRSYLQALFRGGRPRMEYVARATDHLLRATGASPVLWQRATGGVTDPLEVPARLALLLLHLQLQLFEDAMHRGGWGYSELLTLEEIEDDPLGACRVASRALDLELPGSRLESTISERMRRHAKAPEQSYSRADMEDANRAIERSYGPVMNRALDWAALSGLKNDCGVLVRGRERVAG